MTSSCAIRRSLAAKFATAARLHAETAVVLATLGKSGIEYNHLLEQTIEAQGRSEAAFRVFIEHVDAHQCGEALADGLEHLNAPTECIL